METLAIVLPIQRGEKERLLRLRDAITGPRHIEHHEFMDRLGFRENWYTQWTPLGEMMIWYIETDSLDAFFQRAQYTMHHYDLWYFEQMMYVHGVDFTRPPAGPLPNALLELSHS